MRIPESVDKLQTGGHDGDDEEMQWKTFQTNQYFLLRVIQSKDLLLASGYLLFWFKKKKRIYKE